MNTRFKKKKSFLIEKLIGANRVTKVVKGGSNFSVSVIMVVGDQKGRVGFGKGKAKEMSDARNKAVAEAKRKMIKVPLDKMRTLYCDIEGKSGAGKVKMFRAKPGTGIIAGNVMSSVFDCLGAKDVVGKCIGSTNKGAVIGAIFEAFKTVETPKQIAERRGVDLKSINQHA